MSLDSYATLGRSGLRVSPLCLGSMTFGEGRDRGSPVAEAEAIVDRFIDAGAENASASQHWQCSRLVAAALDPRARPSARPS